MCTSGKELDFFQKVLDKNPKKHYNTLVNQPRHNDMKNYENKYKLSDKTVGRQYTVDIIRDGKEPERIEGKFLIYPQYLRDKEGKSISHVFELISFVDIHSPIGETPDVLKGKFPVTIMMHDDKHKVLEFTNGENRIVLTQIMEKAIKDLKDAKEFAAELNRIMTIVRVGDLCKGNHHETFFSHEVLEEVILPFMQENAPNLRLDWNGYRIITSSIVDYANMEDCLKDTEFSDEEAFAKAYNYKTTSSGRVVITDDLWKDYWTGVYGVEF